MTPDPRQLRELLQAATPGPWEMDRDDCIMAPSPSRRLGHRWRTFLGALLGRANSQLAVAAVNALPVLLDAYEERPDVETAARLALERAERAERERDELREAAAECVDYVTAVCHCEWSDDDFGSITRANPDCEVHGGHGRIDRLREAIAAATPAALGRVGAGEDTR